jgi:hypothetical protein
MSSKYVQIRKICDGCGREFIIQRRSTKYQRVYYSNNIVYFHLSGYNYSYCEYSDESVQPICSKVYNCGGLKLNGKSNELLSFFSQGFTF